MMKNQNRVTQRTTAPQKRAHQCNGGNSDNNVEAKYHSPAMNHESAGNDDQGVEDRDNSPMYSYASVVKRKRKPDTALKNESRGVDIPPAVNYDSEGKRGTLEDVTLEERNLTDRPTHW